MKQIKRFSKEFAEYCKLSGIDINKVRTKSVYAYRLTQSEAKEEGCDLNYPYKIDNPFNQNIKL
ncbi:MAG: hypothetical protein LKH27_08150 [Prevotella sp.]|jgi:hypothetical protein|nr:hypothetical protein [Prevotella sp.]MCH3993030.1 hypothetical protein [Prevotella sp.]MCI1474369.1 hypothetical protein [Prevotella sp.]MCI1596075.1 hypothetical protein [Prevotella sp.]